MCNFRFLTSANNILNNLLFFGGTFTGGLDVVCNQYAYLILLCGGEWCEKKMRFLQAFNSGTLPRGGGCWVPFNITLILVNTEFHWFIGGWGGLIGII